MALLSYRRHRFPPIEGSTKRRFFAVLHQPPVDRPTNCGAGGDRSGAAYGEVNLRRGFLRLGIGLAVLWFVFWTFAYVLRPHSSESEPLSGPAFSLTMDIALMTAAILGVPWIVLGFRSN